VLSVGRTWDTGNPFLNAPIHLHQLLAPRLTTMGADELDGLVCASTFGPQPGLPGYARTPPSLATITTYPADGATAIAGNEIASEGPFTLGEIFGLLPGTETGRYLMVFVDGPWQTPLPRVEVTAASLRNATTGQPVELKIADSDVATPDGRTLGDYLPQGAHLIPPKPLAPTTTYEAHVELIAQDTPLARTWRFTTAAAAPAPATQTPSTAAVAPPALPRLRIDAARYRDGRLRFTVRAGKLLVGRRATLTFKLRGGRAIKRTLKLATTRTVRVSARRATLTVRVAAFTAAGGRYGAISVTRSGHA
jgi:hypothetical protein